MNRRDAVVSLLALCAAPSIAQPDAKVRRIGYLSPDQSDAAGRKRFSESLRRLGYEEGRNLVIEWRWGDGDGEKVAALAEELVRVKVEVIVARTNGPINAAKRATRAIPIVMLNGNYPVELGIVESLARPGGNITGTSYISAEFYEKQLQLLKEMAPRTIRVAILWDSSVRRDTGGIGKITADALERAASRLGMKLRYFDAARPEDVDGVLERIAASSSDALLYPAFPLFRTPARQNQIVALALKRRLASLSDLPIADKGLLATFGADAQTFIDRTASYVDRILKGAKPADLPVEQPTKFNLVVNLKTAMAIGLTIPQSILLRADRVIE